MKGSPGDTVLTISIRRLSLRFKKLVALDDFQGSRLGDRSALGCWLSRNANGGSPNGEPPISISSTWFVY